MSSIRSTTLILEVTLPAGTNAYQPVRAKIRFPETGAVADEYQTERPIIIRDAYVASTPSVDYVVRVTVNREVVAGVSRVPASLLVATNPAKPKAFEPEIGIGVNKFVSFEVLPLSNVTSNTTHTLFLSVTLMPRT